MPIAIAAATRSRWKKKFSFGVQHDHPSSSSIPNSVSSSSSSSSSSCSSVGTTPMSFICPISSSLMFDPVITPTGHTFERACIEACRQFNFTPPSLSLISSLDFSSTSSSLLIPNAALRAAIVDWCDHFALPHPQPLSQEYARNLVRNLVLRTTNNSNSQIQMEDEEDYAHHNNSNSNKNKQQQQQQQPSSTSSSSSSSCCSNPSSSSSSSFSSSDIHITAAASTSSSSLLVHVDPKTPKSTSTAAATAAKVPICTNTTSTSTATLTEDSEAESILVNLKNPHISVRVSCLVTLRHSARESSQRRISLCTPKLLSALVPMILSTNSSIQINATAALVNLSIEPANKVKIVRSGAVPPLVQALKSSSSSSSSSTNHSEEARYNAAGALFNLALEDENKLAIGVLGAIPPLVNLFCQGQQQQQQQQQSELAGGHDAARVEAGMALYHLSLAPNNLSKIAKTPGAINSILNIATGDGPDSDDGEVRKVVTQQHEETIRLRLQRVAMMLLASLARRNEGRVALMDADSVKAMMGIMMKDGAAAGREEDHCLAVMYEMSKGGLRFRALARAAGAERVLLAMAGHDNKEGRREEVGKEMVRRTLKVIRGDEEKGGVMLMLGDEYDKDNDEDTAMDWCHCGGGDAMILAAVQEPVLLTFKF